VDSKPAAQVEAATQVGRARIVKSYGELPLNFEANLGQTASQVKFLSRGPGYGLFLTPTAAVLSLAKPHRNSNGKKPMALGETRGASGIARHVADTADKGQRTTGVVEMRLVGANPDAKARGEDELPGRSNYFIGSDPNKWRTNVPTYAKVRYESVYPGVDLIYYGNQGGQLEYDFVVAPGADPSVIALDVVSGLSRQNVWAKNVGAVRELPGAHRDAPLRIASDGDLIVPIDGNEVRFHKPIVYQTDRASASKPGSSPLVTRHSSLIDSRYIITASNRVRFALGAYDHSKPLVIDPVLSYATYFGGTTGYEQGNGIAVDSAGNVYVTGNTTSTDFPTTAGAFQTSLPYGGAFVAKFNPGASGAASLVYSTYLGGHTGSANGDGIALDSAGNAYVTGVTAATDFPTTAGAFQTTAPASRGGGAFVTKLNAAGSALIYSTYLGGSGNTDQAVGIAVGPGGDACVTGFTVSTDFPTTPGAFQATFGGGYSDAFVTKLNAAGSALLYSTYLGGSGSDGVTIEVQYVDGVALSDGIAVDSASNVYVTGDTNSPNFPTTVGAFQRALSSSFGAYIAKINPSVNGAASLVYSTYLSGGTTEAIAVDSAGNAYVTGLVGSPASGTNFPVTSEAFQTVFAGVNGNAFVTKLNAAGSALAYSTYLGGSGDEGTGITGGNSIAVDAAGDAFVGGSTYNQTDFPTVNPLETAGDLGNAFVAELNPAGSALLFSTTLGGPVNPAMSNGTYGYAIAVGMAGNVYLTGWTQTDLFPTVNAFQSSCEGCDYPSDLNHAFVLKISGVPTPGVTVSPLGLTFASRAVDTTSVAQTVTLTNHGSSTVDVTSIVASGDFEQSDTCGTSIAAGTHCTISVTFTPTAAGTRSGTLTITDSDATSPQAVPLSGTGAATAPSVTLSTASLTFTGQPLGTASASQPVTLSNIGNGPLSITSIAVSAKFSQTNNCAGSVAAGSHCTINVSFKPTATGTLTGKLTVTDDSKGVAGSTQTVSLSGTGLPAIAVTLSPSSASVALSGTHLFTATISNASNTALSCYVNGVLNGSSAQGTLTGTGLTRTYTAPPVNVPSPNPAVIKVASVEDPTKHKTASVTVTDTIAVTLAPTTLSLPLSGTQVFTATITGTNGNAALNWYVNGALNGNAAQGTLTACTATAPPTCKYTVPPVTVPSPNPAVIEVASAADPAKYKAANVTVTDTIAVTLSPASASVPLGGTHVFTAKITGTNGNAALNWYVNGVLNGNAAQGTLSACTTVSPLTCKYIAPRANVPSPNPAVIKVVSAADPAKYKTANVTVTDSIVVTLSPSSATVARGGTQLFTATISNTTNTALNWYVNGVLFGNATQGTLTGSGLTRTFTAPASSDPSPNPAAIKVASAADPGKYKTAAVTVTP
jgi:hypothetical protein